MVELRKNAYKHIAAHSLSWNTIQMKKLLVASYLTQQYIQPYFLGRETPSDIIKSADGKNECCSNSCG